MHVDYDTQERTPKDSALWYARLIADRRIPAADARPERDVRPAS